MRKTARFRDGGLAPILPRDGGRTLMTILHTKLPAASVPGYLHGWGAIADAVAVAAR